ncbi:MAG: diguanylate cyclase [Burkholderiales bacterium PBB6]|nr:MAG: diguanylate cyclase [Burkholderiales bacterium PBB6]
MDAMPVEAPSTRLPHPALRRPAAAQRWPGALARRWQQLLSLFLLSLLLALPAISHAMPAREAVAMDYFEDPAGQMTADQIRQLPASAWQSTGNHNAKFGYTRSVFWFRANLTHDGHGSTRRLLEIGYPVLDSIDLWLSAVPDNGSEQAQQHQHLGDKLAFADRPIRHRNFVVPVTLQAGGTLALLARVETSSSMQFPLELWDPDAFASHDQDTMLLHGGYIGVMGGLLIYNLILLITVREKVYALYVAWVAAIGTFLTTLTGLSFQYLWPEATAWNDTALVVLLGLSGATGCAFAATFMKLQPLPAWRLSAVRALVVMNLVATAAAFVLPYSVGIKFSIVSAVLAIGLVTVLAALRANEGYKPGQIFLLAFGCVLAGGAILAANKFGLIERNLLTEHAAQIGSAIEVLLISLGLAARLNEERSLRESAQAAALRVQHEAREQLESRVRERTIELEAVNRKLSQLSMTDGLTAIPNRRYLDDVLARELEQATVAGKSLSVALVDVDHFKMFNDTHGHLAGDLCLQTVARELQAQALRTDDLVARYGGEEFCVVMPGAGPDGAIAVAERMRAAVQALAVDTGYGAVGITVSIGVCSLVPNHPDDLASLLKTADEALYRAKRAGRNRVVLNAGLVVPTTESLTELAISPMR